MIVTTQRFNICRHALIYLFGQKDEGNHTKINAISILNRPVPKIQENIPCKACLTLRSTYGLHNIEEQAGIEI